MGFIAVTIEAGGFTIAVNGDTLCRARTVHGALAEPVGVDITTPGSTMTQFVEATAFEHENHNGAAVVAVCDRLGVEAPDWAHRAVAADWRARKAARDAIMGRDKVEFRKVGGNVECWFRKRKLTTIVPSRRRDGSVNGAELSPALDGPKARYFVGVDGSTVADVIRKAARSVEWYADEL